MTEQNLHLPAKSFNRGFSDYYLKNSKNKIANLYSPKSIGEKLGTVCQSRDKTFQIGSNPTLRNGDGLCYYANAELNGLRVNKVENGTIHLHDQHAPENGTTIYRNSDTDFIKQLEHSNTPRKIAVSLNLMVSKQEIQLVAVDEDGLQTKISIDFEVEQAKNHEKAIDAIHKQLSKSGDTLFRVIEVTTDFSTTPFIPISILNKLRRDCLKNHEQARIKKYVVVEGSLEPNSFPWSTTMLDASANVTNKKAEQFYKRHGVQSFSVSPDTNSKIDDLPLMTTKYCIKYQLDHCPFEKSHSKKTFDEPLYLIDNTGKYRLSFDCKKCEMQIFLAVDM